MRNLYSILIFFLLISCGKGEIVVNKQLGKEVEIFPDYKEVTIPVNIAPLNFSVSDSTAHCLILHGGTTTLYVHAKDGVFDIPQRAWKKLLRESAGQTLEFTVAKREATGWAGYTPFHVQVAKEKIDPYLVYRLIPPYEQWNRMGIYQRNLEGFEQSVIFDNKLTDYNCVNCHSFPMQDPSRMLMHMRAKEAFGTALINGGEVTKVNTKTPETIANLTYPYWHPSGRYIVASVNLIYESYFYNYHDRVDTYDSKSDVVVYDVERSEIFSNEVLKSDEALETFPSFSPDGRSLYFCTVKAMDSVQTHIDQLKYSLCRIDFDPETRTLGTQVDTLFNAQKDGRSISLPRISPDGRQLVATLQEFGNFPVNHKRSDLYAFDMQTGEMRELTEINSLDADSYHSWSSNSRWMAFSSRRLDGFYSRTHFTYVDADGQMHKPFLLPQRNPRKYYRDLMYSYNIPELVKDKVKVNPQDIARAMRETEGITLSYKK